MAQRDLVIGFDADDTLWHNETIFENVHVRYRELLARYHDANTVDRTLLETEIRNLELYGYGVKGFTLSAIETAIQLTEGKISADEVHELIKLGQAMLAHPVDLLEGVRETVASLASKHRLILITKGDLRHQQRKLEKSGLADHFSLIEIVSEKDRMTYDAIFRRHVIDSTRFVMVGNSLKSDIAPVLELGGVGVHIPYHLTWAAEDLKDLPKKEGRFFEIKSVRELPAVISRLKV